MRRLIGYLAVFALGALLAIVAGRMLGWHGVAEGRSPQKPVLEALDRAPIPANIPDTALVTAAKRIEPCVVNIDTVEERRTQGVTVFGTPIERFSQLQGTGSGVIISSDGFIVTNSHVVVDARLIRVTLGNGKHYDGQLVGADENADLAVVKVDAHNLPAAALGDSAELRTGEYVLAIGNPLGIGTTVTHGIVSATDRRNLAIPEGRVLKQAIQTDAPINPGNSGGALANVRGQLVGINTAIMSDRGGGGNIGIGFAIPINSARAVLRTLLTHGRTRSATPDRPFMGVRLAPVPADIAKQLRLRPHEGVLVWQVYGLTGAADAHLERGSIIVSIDGRPVGTPEEVMAAVQRHHVGDTMRVGIMRGDGTRAEVNVHLGRAPLQLVP